MPATLSTIVRPAVTKRANPLSRLLSACWEGIARSLHELDDRALRDIGLVRSQIEGAVWGFMRLSDQARM